MINFCEGVERDTLLPYLDAIVERLLGMLTGSSSVQSPSSTSSGAQGEVKRYVQEQAITTLALVADASESTFAKVSTLIQRYWEVKLNPNPPSLALLNVNAIAAKCSA